MSNLVKRLRDSSYELPSEGEWIERDGGTIPRNVISEAADRIAELEAVLTAAAEWFERHKPITGPGTLPTWYVDAMDLRNPENA